MENKIIVGVLCLNSKIIMGLTKKNVPMKLFKPINKKYPNFNVPTRMKYRNKDVYVTIRYKLKTEKYYIGELHRVIGEVGDLNIEKEVLKYKYGIKYKKDSRKIYYETEKDPYENIRKNYTLLMTVSIDPPNCEDIDDALHYRDIDEQYCEFGIHIADVASYIKSDSILDSKIKNKLESVYLDWERIDMIPTYIALNKYSLKDNKLSHTSSIIYKYDKKNRKIVNYKITKGLIRNHAMSYEKATEILTQYDFYSSTVRNLYNIGKQLSNNHRHYDMHKMVETYMVLANSTIGNEIIERGINGIFRVQKSSDKELIEIKNKKIENMINKFRYEKAEYIYGNKNNIGHNALKKINYCHFTSPIRRYIDIITHRIIYDNITHDYSELCKQINKKHKKVQKAQRESKRLNLIYKIYETTKIIETECKVVNIYKNRINIYIEKYDLETSVKLYDSKLNRLINYESNEKYIVLKNGNIIKKIGLLDTLNIKIVIDIMNPFDKLLVKIEELNDLFIK